MRLLLYLFLCAVVGRPLLAAPSNTRAAARTTAAAAATAAAASSPQPPQRRPRLRVWVTASTARPGGVGHGRKLSRLVFAIDPRYAATPALLATVLHRRMQGRIALGYACGAASDIVRGTDIPTVVGSPPTSSSLSATVAARQSTRDIFVRLRWTPEPCSAAVHARGPLPELPIEAEVDQAREYNDEAVESDSETGEWEEEDDDKKEEEAKEEEEEEEVAGILEDDTLMSVALDAAGMDLEQRMSKFASLAQVAAALERLERELEGTDPHDAPELHSAHTAIPVPGDHNHVSSNADGARSKVYAPSRLQRVAQQFFVGFMFAASGGAVICWVLAYRAEALTA